MCGSDISYEGDSLPHIITQRDFVQVRRWFCPHLNTNRKISCAMDYPAALSEFFVNKEVPGAKSGNNLIIVHTRLTQYPAPKSGDLLLVIHS